MTAGAVRKSTEQKILQGTYEPTKLNQKEPKLLRSMPNAPRNISLLAKKNWGRIAALINAMGVLTDADQMALECLIETYADLQLARETMRKRGGGTSYSTFTAKGGEVWKVYPEVAIIESCDKRIKSWLSDFGLTPATRKRVSVVDEAQGNPFEQF